MARLALWFLLPVLIRAQTCTHQITVNPDGSSVLVYRNGLLLRQGVDYTYVRPVVTLNWWNATDIFSYVYDRMVSIPVPGSSPTASINIYRLNREEATCLGDNPAPVGTPYTKLNPLQVPVGAGLSANSAAISLDTGVALTRSTFQSGVDVTCAPTGGNGLAYTCSPITNNPPGVVLTAYTLYATFVFRPDLPNAAGATVDMGQGPLTLQVLSNGALVNLPAGALAAVGEGYLVMITALPGTTTPSIALVMPTFGSPLTPPIARKICAGSASTTFGSPPVTTGWNCAGLEYYAFTLPDGSIVDYAAVPATPEIRNSVALGPPMWTPAPLP